MKTKLEAAKMALNSGAETWVASGLDDDTLLRIYRSEKVGTKISSNKSTLQSRKLWIASFGSVAGSAVIDNGASQALIEKGKSLLPVGILEIEGSFKRGDLIQCKDVDGNEIARGLSNFSSGELEKIKGINTEEIRNILGHLSEEEVIHRNNLVLS